MLKRGTKTLYARYVCIVAANEMPCDIGMPQYKDNAIAAESQPIPPAQTTFVCRNN